MTRYERLGRRSFISQIGKGVLGVVVLGSAACSDDAAGTITTSGTPATTPGAAAAQTTPPPTTRVTTSPATTAESPGRGSSIERVDLGFVSAYIVVRGAEAAIVDTGVAGSESAIAESLSAVGLGWSDVGHVLLTHLHSDHVGSLGAIMTSAADATGYAGEADIPRINAPRSLTAVATGDQVFGLDVISTPGHTPGHISIFDPIARALITGDAINGAGSGSAAAEAAGVAGPNPDFTADMATAQESVAILASLEPATLYFGHGQPLLDGAAAALRDLATT